MQIDKPDGNDEESLRRSLEGSRTSEQSPRGGEEHVVAPSAPLPPEPPQPLLDEARAGELQAGEALVDEPIPGVPRVVDETPGAVPPRPVTIARESIAAETRIACEPSDATASEDATESASEDATESASEDAMASASEDATESASEDATESASEDAMASKDATASESEDAMASDVERSARRRPLRSHWRSLLGVALIGGATLTALLLGRVAMKRGPKRWYRSLAKPSWTPPERVFGLVWPLLYSLSAASAWRVWRAPPSKQRSAALGIWVTQIATNAAWSPLFFGKRKPAAALADLSANLGSAAGYALAARKVDGTAGLLMLPYVAWVTFAGTINASVVRHNV
ncbi:MAG: tryptophan-rich sensory protein [Labilithrix sp.]|nr:tryptophan-rich sensory protein [Labilithrix sp.]